MLDFYQILLESRDMSNSASDPVRAEIRAELGRQGIRAAELARRLGRNEMWISRRLFGPSPIRVDDLIEIAGALGVPADRFLSTEVAS